MAGKDNGGREIRGAMDPSPRPAWTVQEKRAPVRAIFHSLSWTVIAFIPSNLVSTQMEPMSRVLCSRKVAAQASATAGNSARSGMIIWTMVHSPSVSSESSINSPRRGSSSGSISYSLIRWLTRAIGSPLNSREVSCPTMELLTRSSVTRAR